MPSLSRARTPCSSHSCFVIQKLSLFFMISASTAPPKKTMCLRRGGSSIRILKFYSRKKKGNDKGNASPSISMSARYSISLGEQLVQRPFKHRLTRKRSTSPLRTSVKYNCLTSFSRRLGKPGYMVDPPESTICLYNSERVSNGAD